MSLENVYFSKDYLLYVFPVQSGASHCDEDQVHIVWSSSDGEQSENETQEQQLSRVVAPQRPARPTAQIQSYSRALRMLTSHKGTQQIHLPSQAGM